MKIQEDAKIFMTKRIFQCTIRKIFVLILGEVQSVRMRCEIREVKKNGGNTGENGQFVMAKF